MLSAGLRTVAILDRSDGVSGLFIFQSVICLIPTLMMSKYFDLLRVMLISISIGQGGWSHFDSLIICLDILSLSCCLPVQPSIGQVGISVVPHHHSKVYVSEAKDHLETPSSIPGTRNRFLSKVLRLLRISYLYLQLLMAI